MGLLIVLFAVVVTGTAGSGGAFGRDGAAATNSGGGGGGGSVGGLFRQRCSVEAEAPRAVGGRIVGRGTYRCTSPYPDSFGFWLTLLKQQPDGSWKPATQENFSGGNALTGARELSVACSAGSYRTLIEATSNDDGKIRKYDQMTRTIRNPCG